jgi:hypothetical protein
MIGSRTLFASLALTAIAAALTTLLLAGLGPDWTAYAPANCVAKRCFCELPRVGALIVQPSNTWSSFGFVFAGILIILLSRSSGWRSGLGREAAAWFGATAIFVGVGSALLHATLTLWGQFFDVAGMYLVSGFGLTYALARWRDWSRKQAMVCYAALLAVLVALLAVVPEIRREVFNVVMIAAVAAELVLARPRRPGVRVSLFLAGIACNLVALAIWMLDQREQFCRSEALVQGHAVWHLLGALALWLTFLYYRGERATIQRAPG